MAVEKMGLTCKRREWKIERGGRGRGGEGGGRKEDEKFRNISKYKSVLEVQTDRTFDSNCFYCTDHSPSSVTESGVVSYQ